MLNLADYEIIIPAKNEATSLSSLLSELQQRLSGSDVRITVVDDGSSDNTSEICKSLQINCIRHHESKGNGAAIKSGMTQSTREFILFMDADGQHTPQDAYKLLSDHVNNPIDMLVGKRDRNGQASIFRAFANNLYNRLSSFVTGFEVKDLTSGMRIINREKLQSIHFMLPNGFSYPTTSTIAFLRLGYSIKYIPIDVLQRKGDSHIKPIKDGIKFLLIIIKVVTLYSPLKIFIPISLCFFLTGFTYGFFTILVESRFTNMSALLISIGIVTFLMGLISEQITTLIYKK